MRGEHRRREPWPVVVAALLLFMIGGSVGFLRVALRNPDPLVVADTQGTKRDYPENIRAARRAAALGWEISLDATPPAGAADVRVVLSDPRGRPMRADPSRRRRLGRLQGSRSQRRFRVAVGDPQREASLGGFAFALGAHDERPASRAQKRDDTRPGVVDGHQRRLAIEAPFGRALSSQQHAGVPTSRSMRPTSSSSRRASGRSRTPWASPVPPCAACARTSRSRCSTT